MKALKILVLTALMVLVAVPFASAQITWNSSFTVVNTGTTDATVTVTFYDTAGNSYTPDPLVPGTPPLNNPFTLAPGGSVIVVMAFVSATLPDGVYSVVISSDQPVVAIANLVGIDGNVNYNGSYSGMADTGQVSQFMPSANKDYFGWNSHLSMQNLTGAAMDITVDFYAGTTTPIHTVTQNVPMYSSWHLDVGAEAVLPSNWNGSAVVSASGPVAVADNQYNEVWAPGANQVYNGISAGASTLYCPGLYDLFVGVWISSLNVQNVGAADANVTVYYSDGMSDTVVIAPNAANLFVYNTGAHDPTFSARVEGDQDLVAIVNANAGYQSQTYECFAMGSTEIRSPLAMKWFVGMFNSGLQIQNVGTADANVEICYEGYAADCYSVVVAPNATWIFYTPGEAFLPMDWSGSATITADQPIVGIVNQTNDAPGTATGDFSLAVDMFLINP